MYTLGETIDVSGEWWVPEKNESHVSGQLHFDRHGIKLDLNQVFNPPRGAIRPGDPIPEYPVVHGVTVFFKEHFPEISLASELEKDILIRDLASSDSFAQTHAIIAKLCQYTDFSMSQVNAIVQAAVSNNQIYWIIEEWDVREFLTGIIKGKEEHIEGEKLAELQRLLGEQEMQDWGDDDIPF